MEIGFDSRAADDALNGARVKTTRLPLKPSNKDRAGWFVSGRSLREDLR